MARRALLVGIDNYPDPKNNLNSCVADTLAVKNLLETRYAFNLADMQILHNQNANLANVLNGLDRLFSGVTAEDQIVFFQSSHGYNYPEESTMVEVLCLHDQFLKDTELVQRTQGLPPNVLTVILDACHSGGMNKRFITQEQAGAGGQARCHVAKAKVWQPSPEQANRDTQALSQVTQFKFFGRSSTSDAGAISGNLVQNPVGVPPAKSIGESALELNGLMLAACLADQTAAAGSPPTDNLSAYTYGLVRELDPSVSVAELNGRIGARLDHLNMSQTPTALAPLAQQGLLTSTLISMQPAVPPPAPSAAPAGRFVAGLSASGGRSPSVGDAVETWLNENLRARTR